MKRGRKPKPKYDYDIKCLELALHFLSDIKGATSVHADTLAQLIQYQVELWIDYDEASPGYIGVRKEPPDADA